MSGNGDIKINGVLVATQTAAPQANNKPIWLFARWKPTASSINPKVSIYSFKVWQNNVLVQYLIPAMRNSDSVVGMYDAVSGTFYENAGTGSFIAGDIIGSGETISIDPKGDLATANNLFAVNTYKDVQEIITGATTHNCGVLVLDGTETFSLVSGSTSVFRTPNTVVFPANFASNPNNNVGVCSHFDVVKTSTNLASVIQNGQLGWNSNGAMTIKNDSFTTAAQFTSWLAAQYAAGTPVIVVYPLATPFEEPAPIAQTMTVVYDMPTA